MCSVHVPYTSSNYKKQKQKQNQKQKQKNKKQKTKNKNKNKKEYWLGFFELQSSWII